MEIVGLAVVIVVVFFYAIAFLMSFGKSQRFEAKTINGQTLDEDIAENLVSDNYVYFQGNTQRTIGKKDPISLRDYRNEVKRKKGLGNGIINAIVWVFYAVIALLLISGIFFRASGEQVYIGDSTFMVIQSGSMSEKNKANTWLYDGSIDETRLNYQIQTYDLISISKIAAPEDIKKYDVVAYKAADGSIICHRVIAVNVIDGNYYYQFRGDANNASSDYETLGANPTSTLHSGLSFDLMVGKYTGFHNLPLGLMIEYFRSDIGLICLASGLIAVGFFYYFDDKVNRTYDVREDFVAGKLDESADRRYKWYLCYYRTSKAYRSLTSEIYID